MELLSACYYQRGRNDASLLLQKIRYRQVQILFTCICAGTGNGAGRAGSYMAEQILHWFRNLDIKDIFRKPEKGLMRLEESLCKAVYRTDGELEYSGMMGEERKVNVVGMFCIENRYVMFRRGAGHVCLVNTAFGRVHIRHMCRLCRCVGDGRDGRDSGYSGGSRDIADGRNSEDSEGSRDIVDGRNNRDGRDSGCSRNSRDGKDSGSGRNSGDGRDDRNREGQEDRMCIEQGVLQPDIVMLFSMDDFCRYVTDKMIEDGLAVREVVTEEQMDRHIKELGKEGERLGGMDMGAVLLRTC